MLNKTTLISIPISILLFLVFLAACNKTAPITNEDLDLMPKISLTTEAGMISSEKFLDDDKGEFLLFISPNWGTCISELRKLAKSDQGLSDLANIYIIGMNPGYSIQQLKNMSDNPNHWVYALPIDTDTLSELSGLTRSTKILIGSRNEILGRYRMGQWNLSEWISIFDDA